MLIKIIEKNGTVEEQGVTTEQITSLVSNYYERMKKKKDSWSRRLSPADDTKSAWFSKERLDELFSANGCTPENRSLYGFRIYYGVHKKGILVDSQGNELIKNEKYFNQQSVVLVVTRRACIKCDKNYNKCPDKACQSKCPNNDCLKKDNVIDIAIGSPETISPDEGMDYGKLCPPENCDGSLITID